MNNVILDGFGIYGMILHFTTIFAIVGSTFLIFIYLWIKGRLNMDEEAKINMINTNDEVPYGGD
jgi:uncharacterized membrane protein